MHQNIEFVPVVSETGPDEHSFGLFLVVGDRALWSEAPRHSILRRRPEHLPYSLPTPLIQLSLVFTLEWLVKLALFGDSGPAHPTWSSQLLPSRPLANGVPIAPAISLERILVNILHIQIPHSPTEMSPPCTLSLHCGVEFPFCVDCACIASDRFEYGSSR